MIHLSFEQEKQLIRGLCKALDVEDSVSEVDFF